MLFQFCDDLILELTKSKKEIINTISLGVSNFESYKYACGRIKGIDDSIEIMKELKKQYDEEE